MAIPRHWFLLGALLGGVPALPAQTPDPLSVEVKWTYSTIKNNLVKLAEKMPAENYSFRPTPEVETFGRRVAHIADANMSVCTGLNGERKTLGAASKTTKAELVAALKESFAYCDGVYSSLTDASGTEMIDITQESGRQTRNLRMALLILNFAHNNEIYGNMVTYMRMKDIVPSSSEPRPQQQQPR